MNLHVDNNQKDAIAEAVRNARKPVLILRQLNKYIRPVFYITAAALAILCFVAPDLAYSLGILHPADEPFVLIVIAVILFGSGYIAYIINNIVIIKFSERDLLERFNEELTIDQFSIIYKFDSNHQHHGSSDNRKSYTSKIVISIPLQNIAFIHYEPRFKKIQFTGRFSSDVWGYASEYDSSVPDKGNLEHLIIYDYFSPSLLDQLASYGITPQ